MQAKHRQHSKVSLVAVECQYTYNLGLEGEHKCLVALSDEEWRYCEDHRESGPKQYRALTNGPYVKDYRKIYKDDEDYRLRRQMEQFRVRHRLTEPKLDAFFARAEAQKEDAPHSKYEGHAYALQEFHEIEDLILNPDPHADLPIVAYIAEIKAQELLEFLKAQKRDSLHDSRIDRFILSTLQLQHDIGQWVSPDAFRNIKSKAKAVRQMGQKLYEPLVLGLGLLIDVEMARIQYFAHYATPKKRQFFANKARSALYGAKAFCDMLVDRSKGKGKQVADFLRFYVDCAWLRQASDDDERDHIALHIQAADERANAFAAAYGEAPIVENVQFLNLTNQVGYQLRCDDIDLASQRLTDAKEKFAAMQWPPIEALHRIASLEAQLALARHDPELDRYVHEYLNVLERNPCYEYRHWLRALKDRFPYDVPDVNLLTLMDDALFDSIYSRS